MGFASGIIATVVVSILKSFGLEVQSRLIWSTGNNRVFAGILFLLFGGMIVVGVAVREKGILAAYRRIIRSYGLGGTDYMKEEGGASTLFNMGINGLFRNRFCPGSGR